MKRAPVESIQPGDLIAGHDRVRSVVPVPAREDVPAYVSLVVRSSNGVVGIRSFDPGTLVGVLEHRGRCTGCDRPSGVDCHEECPN